MKVMSAPLRRLFSSSYCSIADCRPSSGSAPEPSPRVESLPMCTRRGAIEVSSDCRSVFKAMNSTPSTPASIIRFTALTPAPPTPTTRRTGSWLRGDCGWWIGSCPTAGSAERGCGSRSRMFSGISGENTERRRSSGVGRPT
jgi:hypothetical protein